MLKEAAITRVLTPLLSRVMGEMDRMKKTGVIKSITEVERMMCPYGASYEKNGHVCASLKRLNETIRRGTIFPTTEDIIFKLTDTKYFCH